MRWLYTLCLIVWLAALQCQPASVASLSGKALVDTSVSDQTARSKIVRPAALATVTRRTTLDERPTRSAAGGDIAPSQSVGHRPISGGVEFILVAAQPTRSPTGKQHRPRAPPA